MRCWRSSSRKPKACLVTTPSPCRRSDRLHLRLEQPIPENRDLAGLRVNPAITQLIDAAHYIATTLIQATGAEVVVLGLKHHARQVLLASPELRHVQQRLGHAMSTRR